MSSRGSEDYYKNDDDYDSNAEFNSPSNSSSRKSSSPRIKESNLQQSKKNYKVAGSKHSYRNVKDSDSSSSDVEILPFEEGIKNLFHKKKEIVNMNEKFSPGLITRRIDSTNPRLVKLSTVDKKVVKDAVVKHVKKTYKNKYILDNISSILLGKIDTTDANVLDDIESILQIYLDVSKQISIDRSVQRLESLRKKI